VSFESSPTRLLLTDEVAYCLDEMTPDVDVWLVPLESSP